MANQNVVSMKALLRPVSTSVTRPAAGTPR